VHVGVCVCVCVRVCGRICGCVYNACVAGGREKCVRRQMLTEEMIRRVFFRDALIKKTTMIMKELKTVRWDSSELPIMRTGVTIALDQQGKLSFVSETKHLNLM